MNKAYSICLTATIIIYSFAACNKFKDKWYPDYNDPQKELDFCRITQIHQTAGSTTDRTGVFYYSAKGNLDSVVFNDNGIVHYWKYNRQNLLIEYRESFNHDITDFRTLHKYGWQNGRINRDTTWLEGASGYVIQVWTLEYDGKGRVIHETGHRIDAEAPGELLPEKVYVYDTEGNLSGGIYDDQINFLRTSKVLQFIHRNYSLNNDSRMTLGYTPYHLPSGFRLTGYASFLGGEYPSRISYSCEMPPPGGGKQDCQIEYLKHITWNNTIFEGTVFFTPGGRPKTLQYIQKFFNSESNVFIFDYDKHERLTGFSNNIGIFGYEVHRYGYSGDRITTDTFYNYMEDYKQISTFYYDNQKRIVKEDIHFVERNFTPVSEYSTKNYQYDSRGNLVSNSVSAYDNKVNYLRTDPAWMLVMRNYSRNNPDVVTQYNSKNLPLGFSSPTIGFLVFRDPVEIRYRCGERVK